MGERGIEPPWIAPHAPKACASASFATRPRRNSILPLHENQKLFGRAGHDLPLRLKSALPLQKNFCDNFFVIKCI